MGKIQSVKALGEEKAYANKSLIYIGASACAEFIADVFLCPLEAVRIRQVSDPDFADSLASGFGKMFKTEGIGGFYSGFLPILAKQIPYTCAKFVVQGTAADAIYTSIGKSPSEVSGTTGLGISLTSGVIAGVAAAIISHPADTLLSKINKAGAGGDGPMFHTAEEHRSGDRLRQTLYNGPRGALCPDRNPNGWPVRCLRHRPANYWRQEVPFPRSQALTVETCPKCRTTGCSATDSKT